MSSALINAVPEAAVSKVAAVSNVTLTAGSVVARVFGLTTDEWTVVGIIAGILFSGIVSAVSVYCKFWLTRQAVRKLETETPLEVATDVQKD